MLTACIEPLNPDDHQITLSVLYARGVDPPIVVFTHVWTKDKESSALIPCLLPQDVKPVPNNVLVMIRSGVETVQPDPVQRPDVVVPQQDSHVQFCGYHNAEHCCNEQTKSSTLPDEDEDE